MTDPLQSQFHEFCCEIQGNIGLFLQTLTKEFDSRSEAFLQEQSILFEKKIAEQKSAAERALKEDRRQLELDRKQFEEEKAEATRLAEAMARDVKDKVTLDIGGHCYSTTMATLRRYPRSLFGKMFSGRAPLPAVDEHSGGYFFDRNGELFGFILDFLRDGSVVAPVQLHAAIRREAEYFDLTEIVLEAPPTSSSSLSKNTVIKHDNKTDDDSEVYWQPPSTSTGLSSSSITPLITTMGHTVMSRDDTTAAPWTVFTNIGFTKGIHRLAVQVDFMAGDVYVGVAVSAAQHNLPLGSSRSSCCYHSSGNIIFNKEQAGYGPPLSVNTVLTVLLDLEKGTLGFVRDGQDLGVAFDRRDLDILFGSEPVYFAVSLVGKNTSVTILDQAHSKA
eukprot:PhM_4_TR9194/c0_g1_i1/m.16018